jgi:hypothetical protein
LSSFDGRFISGGQTVLEGVVLSCSAARRALYAQWEEAHRRFIIEMTTAAAQPHENSVDEGELLEEALRLTLSQDRS